MTQLTEQDTAVNKWLGAISPLICQSRIFSTVSISIQGTIITVQCQHQYMAHRLRKYAHLLKSSGYGLKILVGDEFYCYVPQEKYPMSNIVYENSTLSNSKWARINTSVVDLMSDDGTVSIHSDDRDGGYRILSIQPYQKIDATLCLPKEQLVNQPILAGWDKTRPETEVIAYTKRKVIEEAIASGQKTTHTYQMPWNGLMWRMGVTGVLVDSGEVLLITRQLEDYQRKYWENYVR